VDAAITRSSTNREKMVVSGAERARFAITHYEVLEAFPGEDGNIVASLIACRLETGRTHQIRVHLAHIGHPLLGDALYGSGFRTKERFLSPAAQAALAGLGRQALHARTLCFEHPRSGETMAFDSVLPDDLEGLITALRAS